MDRQSIFHALPCDQKRLPIGGLEAFVLSLVDGKSTAENIADAAGLELDAVIAMARRLVELGALSLDAPRKTRRPAALPSSEASSEKDLVPPAVVPKPRAHPDVRTLGITAREGFVLSQVDGATSTADLMAITHLSAEDVSHALHALEEAGAIELPHLADRKRPTQEAAPQSTKAPRSTRAPARPSKTNLRATKAPPKRSHTPPPRSARGGSRATKAPPRSTKTPPRPANAPRSTKAPASRASSAHVRATRAAPTPEAKAPRPAEKALPELGEEERALIAMEASRLEVLDHYGVLGVARDADAKSIRRAYHMLAAKFHPDRYFGKNLGAAKQPLERVFVRLTRAYDALSKRISREEYDRTLPPLPAAAAPPPTPSPIAPSVDAPFAPLVDAPVAPPASVPSIRAAVARPVAVVVAPVTDAQRHAMSMSSKRRLVVQEKVDVFVRAAEEALARGDFAGAAISYRLAAQTTDDPKVHAALADTDAKARGQIRDVSLKAAQAAENEGRWSDAAAKYAKAHGAKPEPWIAERAANALRREGVDFARATQLAEQAVQSEPDNAAFHVTLGEVYLEQGMRSRAVGEAERAILLAPTDTRAKDFVKRVSKTRG